MTHQKYEVERLSTELANVKANLEESIQQLTSKSKELAGARSDLMAVQRLHTQSEQQVTI